jgi:RimJ/RimL family protein N-acetyltransferase
MQKIGMTLEGTLRKHVLRHNERHDLVCYGILRSEWERHRVLE